MDCRQEGNVSETENVPDFLLSSEVKDLPIATDSQLTLAREMSDRLVALDDLIKSAEERIAEWKKERLEFSRKKLPEFLTNVIGTDHIGVPSRDADVVVSRFCHANIRADWEEYRRKAAFDYLESIGHGDTISVTITMEFFRDQLEEAKEVYSILKKTKYGNSNPPKMEMGVPWGTLTSLVKRRIEAGKSTDLEILGATVGYEAKVKRRK